jgi:type I site-specific restriction endonuclease
MTGMREIDRLTGRLEAGRAAQAKAAKEIAATEQQRTAALMKDDDAAAAQTDGALSELRLAQARATDKIRLLEAALRGAQQKISEQQTDFPQDLRLASQKLDAAQRRLRELEARHDRKCLDEIHHLTYRIPAMQRHVAWLRRIAA